MLEVGDVLYVYNTDVIPAEHKYSVFVCVSKKLFFLINTKNRSIYKCLPITQNKNPYLKYDSFISCNRTFRYTLDQLSENNKVGRLDLQTLKALHAHIEQNVNTLPPAEKNAILTELNNFILDNS